MSVDFLRRIKLLDDLSRSAVFRPLRRVNAMLAVGIGALVALVAPSLAQWPPRGAPERAAFERAFYGTPHFLRIRMGFQRRGQDQVLEAIVECEGGKHTPALGSLQKPYSVKVPSRKFISTILSDGSAVFLHLPPGVCGLWPERWMPERFARSLQPESRYPQDFHPLVYWADRAQDPDRVEMYVTRATLTSPSSEIAFRNLSFTVVERSNDDASRRQARREAANAVRHPIGRYNPQRSATPWHSWTAGLQGVPESLWAQYPRLSSLIAKHGARSGIIVFTAEELAEVRDDLVEVGALLTGAGGQGLESGLPGPDGRTGVMFCRGHDVKARATFLPNRCTVPRDWDIPIICDHSSGCTALIDRRGTHLYFRGGNRPPAYPTIVFDGRTATRSKSGDEALVYLPALRLLVRL